VVVPAPSIPSSTMNRPRLSVTGVRRFYPPKPAKAIGKILRDVTRFRELVLFAARS
jgi:hypothetical protein